MLFVETKILDQSLDGEARIFLLKKLQEKGLIPLIYSTRLSCYGLALQSQDGGTDEWRLKEMGRVITDWIEAEDETLYIQGDVFCFDNYVHFLIFGDMETEANGIRAGIIYDLRTIEPLRKLDAFCRNVSAALASARTGIATGVEARAPEPTEWRREKAMVMPGFTRFVAKQDIDSLYTVVRKETMVERIRAAKLLEDDYTRQFLRRSKEAHVEGCATKLLAGDKIEGYDFSIDKLSDVGLVRREVLVSCRQTGHALFRLPSPDALAVVTVSHALCSECGAAVADEKVEEVVAPTQLAAALLEDGSWLVNRLHSILRQLGIPESEIVIGSHSADGEAHMMANVCGESFLFALRDGDLSPAFARRAIDMEIETEATHLVILATGRIHNEARVRLLDHARRRARLGNEVELIILEGAGAAAAELEQAFERVSQKVLAEHLAELDVSLGLSVSRLIITRFQLLQKSDEVKDVPGLSDAPPAANLHDMRHMIPLPAQASSSAHDVSNHSDVMSSGAATRMVNEFGLERQEGYDRP